MLQITVSYKSLLRVIGWCFLVYGIYLIVLVLSAQIVMVGSINYTGPIIFEDPFAVRNYLLFGGFFGGNLLLGGLPRFGPFAPGPLLWVSLGVLCFSLTSRRVNIVYTWLQVSLWLISMSIWFPVLFLLGTTNYGPESFVPLELVTLAFSLILLTFYKPVALFLRKLLGTKRVLPAIKS